MYSPSLILICTTGQATEVVKGVAPFVNGIAEYSVTFKRGFILNAGASVYFRVAAVNAVGPSLFAYPIQNPIILYNGPPRRPTNVAVTNYAKTALLVTWTAPLNLSYAFNQNPYTYFDIEYDTSPAFTSWCGTSICSTLRAFSLGRLVVTNTTLFSYVIDHLVPGVEYFVRVKVRL